ncbi:unnamed protein product [Cuscuta epithymum]|uniref:HD-Zip IV C-terminal domain-containing protein n=1 Tax=Cuscuta epithymum TaxID=186058 RepID=A0AAV0FJ51_9ASTE|nr:unnamed protein product [Cuscuta epithymum]CAH9135688.1 unnamed protein product [Cuscuta epithymum]
MFGSLLTSNFPFSANRWISALERYYDKIVALEGQGDNNNYNGYHFQQPPAPNGLGIGNKNMLKLAQRMMKHYARNVMNNKDDPRMVLPATSGDIYVRRGNNILDATGLSLGVALTISTSLYLPVPHDRLFNFLRSGSNRNLWDILSIDSNIRDDVNIYSSRDPANSISLLIVESPARDKNVVEATKIYLQESYTDSVAMYVVYAPVDMDSVCYLLDNGKDGVDHVKIMPSGFAILPDVAVVIDGTSSGSHYLQPTQQENVVPSGGSILTISFQILDEKISSVDYLPPESVLIVRGLVCKTISLIKDALLK